MFVNYKSVRNNKQSSKEKERDQVFHAKRYFSQVLWYLIIYKKKNVCETTRKKNTHRKSRADIVINLKIGKTKQKKEEVSNNYLVSFIN